MDEVERVRPLPEHHHRLRTQRRRQLGQVALGRGGDQQTVEHGHRRVAQVGDRDLERCVQPRCDVVVEREPRPQQQHGRDDPDRDSHAAPNSRREGHAHEEFAHAEDRRDVEQPARDPGRPIDREVRHHVEGNEHDRRCGGQQGKPGDQRPSHKERVDSVEEQFAGERPRSGVAGEVGTHRRYPGVQKEDREDDAGPIHRHISPHVEHGHRQQRCHHVKRPDACEPSPVEATGRVTGHERPRQHEPREHEEEADAGGAEPSPMPDQRQLGEVREVVHEHEEGRKEPQPGERIEPRKVRRAFQQGCSRGHGCARYCHLGSVPAARGGGSAVHGW